MSRVVIKKKVVLDFLGEGYKEAFIEFKAITLRELDEVAREAKETKEPSQFIKEILDKKFIGGKFPDEKGELFDLTKEDLLDFDVEAVTNIFKRMTGQEADPNLVQP